MLSENEWNIGSSCPDFIPVDTTPIFWSAAPLTSIYGFVCVWSGFFLVNVSVFCCAYNVQAPMWVAWHFVFTAKLYRHTIYIGLRSLNWWLCREYKVLCKCWLIFAQMLQRRVLRKNTIRDTGAVYNART